MKTTEDINQLGIEYAKEKYKFSNISWKQRNESEIDFMRGYNACQSEINSSQFPLPVDEEILIYFNNHSNCRADMPVKIGDNPKIPAMTRSAVIEFAKWFRSRMSKNLREELIRYHKWYEGKSFDIPNHDITIGKD